MLNLSFFVLGLNVSQYALPNGTEPLVLLDFKNGAYTVNGASVALNTVLTQNTDFGSWNPVNVHAGVGLIGGNNSQPVFTGDALALIIGGSTIVCTLVLPDPATTAGRVDFEMIDSPDYDLDISTFSANGRDNGCDMNDGDGGEVHEPGLALGTNKIALTLINGKIARSTNGNLVKSVNPSVAWTPPPSVMLLAAGGSSIVETVGIYPAQADADLSGLSDLGYPRNTVAPVITGTARVGQTVSVSTGTWIGAVSYAYQWYDLLFNSPIPGATSASYLIDPAYEGSTLMVAVAATNATGTSIVGAIDDDTVIAA